MVCRVDREIVGYIYIYVIYLGRSHRHDHSNGDDHGSEDDHGSGSGGQRMHGSGGEDHGSGQ